MIIFKQLKRSMAIAKKDLSIFYLKGPVVISGLLIPSFLFIAFIVGKDFSFNFLMPGLLGMALFVTVTSIGPVVAPWETRMRTFERLVSTPITIWAIILGDITASLLFGLFITFFILLIGIIILGVEIISLGLIVGTILAAFCFSSLGLVISAPPTDNPSNIMMISSLVKFPLIFISGVFVPINEMGSWRVISYISPLTYYTDLARYSVGGTCYFNPTIDLLALLGFSILFFTVAVRLHKKGLSKRF